MARHRTATATSQFGSGRRESHDSTPFYERFAPPLVSGDERVSSPVARDVIFHGDARRMGDEQVADRSVALIVTSPPYFAGKEYEMDLAAGHVPASYVEYLEMLYEVLAVCMRKLEPGGRMAINVANLGRKPYRSLSADVISIMQDDLGMLMRGEVIWQKARGAGGSCAWGSFRSPQNPVLRDVTERVIIASKGRFDRAVDRRRREAGNLPHEATIATEEFLEATIDVWEIPTESARKIGHPAPFPVALPRRLIELYTYKGDLVLDPFMGSGTTAVAAARSGRHYVGFDTDQTYIELAEDRLAEEAG
ncbi:MAG: DNA-methyltransferase [Acidimicrobiia bacterium]